MLKTVSSITNAIGALNFKGTWNASTNTPTIVSGVGVKGDYFVVSVAGSTTIDGISNWGVGDWITYNGTVWQRVEGGADLNGVNLSASGTTTLNTLNTSGQVVFNDAGADVDFRVEGDTNGNLLFVDADVDKVGIGTNTFNTNGGVLQVSNGISFPATQSALSDVNTLDDYEEGVFTPTITFDGASAGITYNTTFTGATYTKIGNRVFVSGYVLLSNKGSSTGGAAIANLPFTSIAGNTRFQAATVAGSGFTFANQFWARIGPNSTSIDVIEVTEAGVNTAITDADCSNNTDFYFSAHYTT